MVNIKDPSKEEMLICLTDLYEALTIGGNSRGRMSYLRQRISKTLGSRFLINELGTSLETKDRFVSEPKVKNKVRVKKFKEIFDDYG